MCAECDTLLEQMRIVRGKHEALAEGLSLIEKAREELETSAGIAAGIAAAYVILQSLNISFGLATLPCAIPVQWLKALMGGAAGLGSYVQEGKPSEATGAAIVSYFGSPVGAGVVMDAISTVEFMRLYQAESKGIDALKRDLDKAIRAFVAARSALEREQQTIEASLIQGGCKGPLDSILGR